MQKTSQLVHTAKTQYRKKDQEQNVPRKGIAGFNPNFYIHVSVRDLYIPCGSVPLFCYRKMCGPMVGIYKSLTDT
jgi:hypothetical protein